MSDIGRSERGLVESRRAGRRADQIEVRGLRVLARHGVYAEEQREEQPFLLDVILDLDALIAARTDDVQDTIDYAWVVSHIADLVRSTRFHLLEALGAHIAEQLLRMDRVSAVCVRITKPEITLDEEVDAVIVTIRRARPVHVT